jgi:Protein of unknown function (DUF3352)
VTKLARALLGVALLATTSTGCSLALPNATPAAPAAGLAAPDSWLFASINFRPGLTQLAHADQLSAAFTKQPGFDTAVRQLEQLGPMPGQVDFGRDVLPLLDGELAVVISGNPGGLPGRDASRFGTATGAQPRVLVAAHSSDPNKLLGLGQAVPSRSQPLPGRSGAMLYPLNGGGVGVAYKGWALIASGADELAPVLDRVDSGGKGGLVDQQRFKSVVERLPTERVAYTYVDTAALLAGLEGRSPGPSEAPDIAQQLRQAAGRAALSATLESDGVELRSESIRDLPPSTPVGSGGGDALEALTALPSDTLVAFAGSDLPGLVSELEAQAGGAVVEELAPPGIEDVLGSLGDWLSGEFAAGVAPGTLGEPEGEPDLVLIAGVGDPDAANQSLDQLQQVFPPKSVYQVDVAGRTLNQVVPEPGETLTYGVADSWLYLIRGDAEGVLSAADDAGLDANPRYQMVTERLTRTGTDVFVDLEAVRALLEQQLQGSESITYRRTVEPLVAQLRAFGGGTRTDPNGDSHGRHVLAIR